MAAADQFYNSFSVLRTTGCTGRPRCSPSPTNTSFSVLSSMVGRFDCFYNTKLRDHNQLNLCFNSGILHIKHECHGIVLNHRFCTMSMMINNYSVKNFDGVHVCREFLPILIIWIFWSSFSIDFSYNSVSVNSLVTVYVSFVS